MKLSRTDANRQRLCGDGRISSVPAKAKPSRRVPVIRAIALFVCLAAPLHAQDSPKSTGPTEPQPPQSTAAKPVQLSADQMQKLFVKRERPVLSQLAQQARVTGKVGVRVTVRADGSVMNIMLVYGHPMLAGAAIEAAKKSKYRPYLVDGKPVEAEGPVEYDIY